MALASETSEDQSLECPLCLEDFENPVTLACGHNLCLKCARLLSFRVTLARDEDPAFAASCQASSSTSSPGNSSSTSKPGTFGVDCPLCRKHTVIDEEKGAECLPPNIYLRNVVENKKKAAVSLPQCGVCNAAQAKWTCLDCKNTSFCDKCIEQHNATMNAIPWLKGQHNAVPAQAKGTVRAVQTCTEHKDEPLKAYCIQDDCLVCRDCITFGAHMGHKPVLLKDAVAIWKAKIADTLEEANEKWAALDQDYAAGSDLPVKELTKRYGEGVKQVTQAFDALVKDIQAEKRAVLAKMLAGFNARKRYIESADGVYQMTKAGFEKLKQDVSSNDTALAAQASEDTLNHAAYLDTMHLHKKLQALIKDVDELGKTELDTGRGGMWCDAQKWTDALTNIATELRTVSEKHCTTSSKPDMKPSSLMPPVRASKFLLTASQDMTARLWNSSTYEHVATLTGHTGDVYCAMYSPSRDFIITASTDKTARIWNSDTHECVATLQGHTANVMSARYSPDARFIVTASCDMTARIWNSSTYECVATLQGHTAYLNSAMYSPDGKFIVTASYDNTARIWNSSTYACVATLTGHTSAVYSASYSPDGNSIITASDDKTARIWNSTSYQHVATLTGHTQAVYSAMYSPDGKHIVTGSSDKTARIWNSSTYACVATLKGHTAWIWSAMYSPDGKFIYTASGDKTARIWNSSTYACMATLQGHTSYLRTLCN